MLLFFESSHYKCTESPQMGDLVYYSLSDMKPVSEYRHPVGWQSLHPDSAGTLLVAVDIKSHGYIYSPVRFSMSTRVTGTMTLIISFR